MVERWCVILMSVGCLMVGLISSGEFFVHSNLSPDEIATKQIELQHVQTLVKKIENTRLLSTPFIRSNDKPHWIVAETQAIVASHAYLLILFVLGLVICLRSAFSRISALFASTYNECCFR